MDVLDSIHVPEGADASTVIMEPEVRNKQLLHRLQQLKNEATYWQDEIDRLGEHSDNAVNDSALLDALLSRNDRFVSSSASKLDEQVEEQNKEEEFSVRPIRDDVEYLAKFHALDLKPCTTSKLVGRDLFLNEFEGWCSDLFWFKIALYVHPTKQSVHSFTVTTSPWVRTELEPLVKNASAGKNILGLMHGLAEYGNLYTVRRQTFAKLAKNYNAQDELWRTSSRLVFDEQNGFQMVLSWPIDTANNEPRSKPTIDLKAAKSYHKADKTSAMGKVRPVFQTLVESKGVFAATCIIHDILHG